MRIEYLSESIGEAGHHDEGIAHEVADLRHLAPELVVVGCWEVPQFFSEPSDLLHERHEVLHQVVLDLAKGAGALVVLAEVTDIVEGIIQRVASFRAKNDRGKLTDDGEDVAEQILLESTLQIIYLLLL